MSTRSGLIAFATGAWLLAVGIDVCASPYTAYMEGTTVLYFDLYGLTDVPANVGQAFSATVVFDVANGTLNSSSNPDNSYMMSFSVRGCDQIVNGACAADFGAQLPVVTDYSVNVAFAPLGAYRPVPTSAYYYDATVRLNDRLPNLDPPLDIYVIERNQEQCNVTGDLASAYTQDCTNRRFYIYLSDSMDSMFGSLANVFDLNKTPNLADVPPGYISFSYSYSERIDDCTKEVDQDAVCVTRSYAPASGYWLGTLTSFVVMSNTPTMKDQCKNGGWKSFGFKNQGQCVSYVNHHP